MRTYLLLLIGSLLTLASCKKDPITPSPILHPFGVTFHNAFTDLQGHYGAYLSDADGKVLAFRWIKGSDTTRLMVPDFPENQSPDLTLMRVETLFATGSGITDTSITVRTFAAVPNDGHFNLQALEYRRETDLSLAFTGVTSFDSIIVPDAITLLRPQANNGFTGLYKVRHTGKIWLRFRVNGEPNWRYMVFSNVQNDQIGGTFDVNLLPVENKPTPLALPFVSQWKYRVDGVIDTATRQYFALGDLMRAPGGAIPIFGELSVFEPITFDPIIPPNPYYQTYRLRFEGRDPNSVGYFMDDYSNTLPTALPNIPFNVEATLLSDNRLANVRCVGDFDALVLVRNHAGQPNITWESYLRPGANVLNRLPDVPDEIGDLFPAIKQYNFGQAVRGRAEGYIRLNGYDAVLKKMMEGNDPFWQAKGGYLGREVVL